MERENYRGHVGLDQTVAQSWINRDCGTNDCWNLELMVFFLSHVELVLGGESRAKNEEDDHVAPGCWEKSAFHVLELGFSGLFCKHWLMR